MARIQFGRLCQLEFRNYSTNKKFKIDQNLRISFEFLKAFDESDQSSKGTISIYGLSKETAFKLGNRLGTNFQSEVTCSVGYSGDIQNFQPLFVGTVMNNHWQRDSGTSVTTIEVSANFRDFYLGVMNNVSYKTVTFVQLLDNLKQVYNLDYSVDIDHALSTHEQRLAISQYLYKLLIKNWSFVGTLREYLNKIADMLHMGYSIANNTVTFLLFDPQKIEAYYKLSKMPMLPSQNHFLQPQDALKTTSETAMKQNVDVNKLFINSNEKTAVTVGFGTGLVAMPQIDNRNVKVPYTQQLGANEALVERKEIKAVVDKKTGEQKRDKDGKLKWKKPPKTVTISRRHVLAQIQLNPSIKPNSMIRINTQIPEIDGVYRARNCKFKGDTHEGEWVVELDLEDTTEFNPVVLDGGELDEESYDQPIEGLTENITNNINEDGDDES